jgi:hypothetical protein
MNELWATSLRVGLRGTCFARQSVGFAVGDELLPYLAWCEVPVSAARRVGLLLADGRERLAGRIVFPEIRQRQPVWLIGRLLEPADTLVWLSADRLQPDDPATARPVGAPVCGAGRRRGQARRQPCDLPKRSGPAWHSATAARRE